MDETLQGAINKALIDIGQQLGPQAQVERTAVIDPLLDGKTGQQTRASERASQQLGASIHRVLRHLKVLPFDETGAQQSRWLINGTLTPRAGAEPGSYQLTVAVSDRPTGLVIARGVAPLRDEQLDQAPTRLYADSPSLVRDRATDGYLRTAETPAGKPADALYLEQISTGALLADAQEAYNTEKWDRALELYAAAVKRPDGQQLRAFNGLYLANMQLGRADAAEEAFGKIAAFGLATDNLAMKLLFRPGSTEFLADGNPNVEHYPMWLRQIARAAQGGDMCLNIVGHTSKTGSEPLNERLSLQRAVTVRDRLVREAQTLARRARTAGVGSRENLVGSGTDDLRDSLDRRVEFKVVPCG